MEASYLLENLISSCNGIYNPIRNFLIEEINIATNNFDRCHIIQKYPLFLERGFRVDEVELYGEDDNYAFYVMYRGCLDDRPIIVKKFKGLVGEDELRSLAIRDMVITTQMSKHKNVLELLGYCLEFPVPVLFLENAKNGALNDQGGFGANEYLPWKIRVQVAKELANALTYLHTALSRPIIHRDIRDPTVFSWTMTLFLNLATSHLPSQITIPPDQSHSIDTVKGDLWHLDPTYRYSRSVTQKSNVYSFGVFLLVLLAGERPMYDTIEKYERHPVLNDKLTEIVDPKLSSEGGEDGKAQQIGSFLKLASACSQKKSEARPDMIDVAKELMQIEKSCDFSLLSSENSHDSTLAPIS